MRRFALLIPSLYWLSVSASPAIAAGALYSITEIGQVSFPVQGISPVAINASGTVSGTVFLPQSSNLFTFSGGTFTLFNIPGTHDTGSTNTGLNLVGQLIGTETGPLPTAFGFVFYQNTVTPLPAQFAPAGINDNGSIAGTVNSTGRAAVSDASGLSLTDLGTLGGTHSAATAINNVSQITGSASLPGDSAIHAFLWNPPEGRPPGPPTMQDLGTLGGTNSQGLAINSGGYVAGTSDISGGGATHAFLFNHIVMQDLGTLSGYANSYAYGVNSPGQVVGAAANLQGSTIIGESAFVYRDGRMIDLNTLIPASAPWFLSKATAINDAGQIVGTGVFNGQPLAGFLLTPIDTAISCQVSGVTGPPRQLTFVIQNASPGLQSIAINSSTNATVTIPPFAGGITAPITVTAKQTDPTQDASVQLLIANTAGILTTCGGAISAGPAEWNSLGGVLISNVASALNSDGSLEAFGVGTDHALWHTVQSAQEGRWLPWTTLGGNNLSGDPSIVIDKRGLLQAFVIAGDNSLWNLGQTSTGNWSGSYWQNIASNVQGRPAAVVDVIGKIQVFVRGLDNSLVAVSQTSPAISSWGAPNPLGGVLTSNPAATLDGSGYIQLFAVGADQALWNLGLTSGGAIFPWTSLGGVWKGDPAVITRSGAPFVFARCSDDSLWYISRTANSGWSAWKDLGGLTIGTPSIAMNSDGRLELFILGGSQDIWHSAQTAPDSDLWSPWSSLGGYITSSALSAVSDAGAIIDIFAVGGDRGLWKISQTIPGAWN
jgi:probable HAF family extracellular repeat protein